MSKYSSIEIEVVDIRDEEIFVYSSGQEGPASFACSSLYQGDIASVNIAVDVQLVAH